MKKKIVALLLSLVMLVGIIPAAVYATGEVAKVVTLTVTPDKTVAVKGDTITFTVAMTTDLKLASMAFTTEFPEGLTYVDGSGKIDSDAKATLAFDDVAWTEWSKRIGAEQGDNYINGVGSESAAADNVTICTFETTADAVGEFTMSLIGLNEFCDTDWTEYDEEQIEVVSTAVTVLDHVCADNLTEVAGVDATCVDEGTLAHFVCGKCGTKYTDATASEVVEGDTFIAPKGHDDGVWLEAIEATCTETGLKELKCACGTVLETEEIPAKGHTEDEAVKENEVDAACTTDGSYDSVVYCTDCRAEISRTTVTVTAHGHDDGEWVVVEEGNCVVAGLKELRCTICGAVLDTEEKPALGVHTYEAVVTAPTATAEGYTTYTCKDCGDDYVADYTAKITGKVVLTVANTNNTILTGIVNSDYSAEISVPHGVTIDTSKVTLGLTMTDVASLGISGTKSFEKVLSTGVDKEIAFDNYIPSDFVGATVSGTIDGVAYKYRFEGVDTAEKFTITATPDAGVQPAWHALTSHITTETQADDTYAYVPSAAYVQIGTEKLVFENDYTTSDDLRTAVTLYDVEALEDAQAEIFLPAGTVIALSNYKATLADEAIITIYGYEDSESLNTVMSQLRACETTTDIIKTLVLFIGDVATAIDGKDVTLNVEFGHDYTAVVTDPTCTSEGYTTYTCSICGDTYVGDYVEALAHAYESEIIEPTCTEEGYTLCTCANCGDTHKTAVKAALGHTAAEAVKENEVAATCTATGSYDSVVYCSVCGVEMSRETVEVAKLAHDYKAVVTEPTCLDGGYTTYTCAYCSDSYVADETAATGHTAGAWVATEEKGKFNQYCSICGALMDTKEITGLEISTEYVKTKYVRKAPAFTLTAEVLPEANADLGYKVIWTSSNEKVATVDEDGNVTTHHFGDAVITATLVDGNGNEIDKEACTVEVYYTFCQWLIWLFLLGCTWYFV